MHPLVMPTAARHRRTLTTAQRLRIAATILLTIAVLAAFGVFGGSMTTQTEVLQWFSRRGVPLALVSWATYAFPLLALSKILSPATRALPRALSYLALPIALMVTALMSRPAGMTPASWKEAHPADFVAASQLTAYSLLAFAVAGAACCVLALSRAATPADDALITVRRITSRTILLALAGTLITLRLT